MRGGEVLAEELAKRALEGSLSHAYLVVARDRAALEDAAPRILRAVDGVSRLQLADGLLVRPEEGARSIGIKVVVDEVRPHLQSFPGVSAYRGALILHAELLTAEAQNALLKIAEEPPERSVLVLATLDEERILPTLRSRMQRLSLVPAGKEEVAAWLGEEGHASGQAAQEVATRSRGSFEAARELAAGSAALALADRLLGASPSGVAQAAKEAAQEEVGLADLARALSVRLAYTARTPRNLELWHRVQRLARQAQASPLNLKLQIAAIFHDLPS